MAGLFLRSTLLDEAARVGSAVPEPLRLAHLTGLADLLNDAGRLTVSGNQGTLFARGAVTATVIWADSWLPVAVTALVAAVLGLGYGLGRRPARFATDATMEVPAKVSLGPGPLGWYALITLGWTSAAVLGYSAFFCHYADFTAHGWPSCAVTPPVPCARNGRGVLAVTAVALVLVASFEAWELSGSQAPDVRGLGPHPCWRVRGQRRCLADHRGQQVHRRLPRHPVPSCR